MNKYITLICLSFCLFSGSCTYEDGPGISLRSKKARAVNTWVIQKAIEEGKDKTDEYKTTFVNYKLELKENNEYRISYRPLNVFDYVERGTWSFSSDKRSLVFKPVKTSQENTVKILRLKNHEAWVLMRMDGKDVELRMED